MENGCHYVQRRVYYHNTGVTSGACKTKTSSSDRGCEILNKSRPNGVEWDML